MTRAPREIAVPTELGRRLAAARDRASVDAEPMLNLDRLQDVEAAMAIEFSDDVLSLFSARVPELGVALEKVVGVTGELKSRKVRGDWIGLGALPSGKLVALSKGRQPPSGSVVVVIDPESGDFESLSSVEFVRRCCGELPPSEQAFSPRLFRPEPESTMQGRKVRHKQFGLGSLLSEQGSGPTRRCKVAFPSRGLKVLQARFLEFDPKP